MLRCTRLSLGPWEKSSILVLSARREPRPTIFPGCLGRGLRGRLLGLNHFRISDGKRRVDEGTKVSIGSSWVVVILTILSRVCIAQNRV